MAAKTQYILRRQHPSKPGCWWYYSKAVFLKWTEVVGWATFFPSLQEAEKAAMEILEEINIACEIIGPYS